MLWTTNLGNGGVHTNKTWPYLCLVATITYLGLVIKKQEQDGLGWSQCTALNLASAMEVTQQQETRKSLNKPAYTEYVEAY